MRSYESFCITDEDLTDEDRENLVIIRQHAHKPETKNNGQLKKFDIALDAVAMDFKVIAAPK